MRSLADALSTGFRSLRTASPTMTLLRLALLASSLCCLAAVQPAAVPWDAALVVLMLASIVLPDSVVPTLFLAGVLVAALAHGRPSAWHVVVLTAGMALTHWSAVQCARGPLQTRLRPAATVAGGWTTWLGVSAAAAAAVALVARLTGHALPGGLPVVALGVVVALAGLVAVLLVARTRDRAC